MTNWGAIEIQSVSLGKGHVAWRVAFPPMTRRPRGVEKEYRELVDACRAVKAHCTKDACSESTVHLIEQHCPDESWAS